MAELTREEIRAALKRSAEDTCSLHCPSVKYDQDQPWPHSQRCEETRKALRALLERAEDSERLEAMIAGNWNVEQMPCGSDKGRWFVFDVEARNGPHMAVELGEGDTPRAAIDAALAKKEADHAE